MGESDFVADDVQKARYLSYIGNEQGNGCVKDSYVDVPTGEWTKLTVDLDLLPGIL